jgi:hypothetical protein
MKVAKFDYLKRKKKKPILDLSQSSRRTLKMRMKMEWMDEKLGQLKRK